MALFDVFLNTIVPFLIVLTILVFVHEMGHYLVARRNGVRVEVFSIGFGPELFGWNDKAQTRWKISLIPLGGYVKMFGDANAASARNTVSRTALIWTNSKNDGMTSGISRAGPYRTTAAALSAAAAPSPWSPGSIFASSTAARRLPTSWRGSHARSSLREV